jgi:hypothetical protein
VDDVGGERNLRVAAREKSTRRHLGRLVLCDEEERGGST